MRAFLRTFVALFLASATVAAGPPRAHADTVDLALVLAVDVSGSVDAFEAQLQREGYIRALVHPQVIRAITSGERKKIAVTYVEWAGSYFQRTVVDWTVISGDGPNNSGRPVRMARDEAVKKGVTINGLPIVNDRPNPWGRPPPPNLDKYYFNNVIGGRGAFIVVAKGFKNFAEAIRNKMVREIAGRRYREIVPAAARD